MRFSPFAIAVFMATLATSTAGVTADDLTALRSQPDAALDYPIRVVEAEPFWRMPEDKHAMIQEGLYRPIHRPVGTLPAERLRLPTPEADWKLTGRVGRLDDGTIVAGFGFYLYWSRDEGRTWEGRLLHALPDTDGPTNLRAFGVASDQILLAHDLTSLPEVDIPDRQTFRIGISRSCDLGATWRGSGPIDVPGPYTFLAGDGNHIVALPNGTLVAALDAANHNVEAFQAGWLAQVFLRSRDGGASWSDATLIEDTAAEVGLLPLGGAHVLAACRGMSNPVLGGKTIQLRRSDDAARTWSEPQQLTTVFGQAHGDLARLPGDMIAAVYENRYPVGQSDIRARISHDLGKTWEPNLYILADGVGYAGSVGLADGTIVTVTGDGQMTGGKPTGRGYTLQAIRWKP
jgi:BNR repeat-like domain